MPTAPSWNPRVTETVTSYYQQELIIMPFIPHTDNDIRDMLAAIKAGDIEDLFDEIPENLRIGKLEGVPEGQTEQEISRLMMDRAEQDGRPLCFMGAGAYEHHIPTAVWDIATRGEYYSAYTPYQAEASQGTLQLIYEFQTMMTRLTGMDVSNASLYDGASGLAEAVLMAVRGNRKSKSGKILVPTSVHPNYRKTTRAIVANQGIELIEVPYDREGGHTPAAALAEYAGQDIAAIGCAPVAADAVLESQVRVQRLDAVLVTDLENTRIAIVFDTILLDVALPECLELRFEQRQVKFILVDDAVVGIDRDTRRRIGDLCRDHGLGQQR